MTHKPAALLFDLDGTLVDTIELIMRSMEFAFADFTGPRPSREEWLEGLGIPLRPLLAAHARTTEELDWMIARYRLFQGEHHDALTTAFPGVADTLATLSAEGHSMAVVTSKFHATAVKALTHAGLAQFFGSVVGADSIANPKPHPEPVLRALSDLGADPKRAFMIGDSPHDIRAGNDAGVATIGVTWGPFPPERLVQANATHVLADIRALPALVQASARGAPRV